MTTTHPISYAAPQDGIAFRVENAVTTLTYLRTFFPAEFPTERTKSNANASA